MLTFRSPTFRVSLSLSLGTTSLWAGYLPRPQKSPKNGGIGMSRILIKNVRIKKGEDGAIIFQRRSLFFSVGIPSTLISSKLLKKGRETSDQ